MEIMRNSIVKVRNSTISQDVFVLHFFSFSFFATDALSNMVVPVFH